MTPELLNHAQTIPTLVDKLKYTIVNGSGATTDTLPLIWLSKR
jgi:hypothetical protein